VTCYRLALDRHGGTKSTSQEQGSNNMMGKVYSERQKGAVNSMKVR
jgi:hypothetical protein